MNESRNFTPTICIVDYGMGNVASVRNAFAFLGVEATISETANDLAQADAIILPGVGAFGEAMANLTARDLVAPLSDQIRDQRKPFLGICLGMQLLAEESCEMGNTRGLGWVPGSIQALPPGPGRHIPHVGWSEIDFDPKDPLFARIPEDGCFFFDHSYYLDIGAHTTGATEYGASFTAVLRADNIFATQFHPEKSQRNGLKLLRNFVNYCAARHGAEPARDAAHV